MTVYGPDVTEAMETYSSQFDDLKVGQRRINVDLNAINPLSKQREKWQNATSDETEHRLSTAASTNEVSYLRTKSRGQYVAGYEGQAGMGVRIPTLPSKDETMRWGYYTVDSSEEPLNGWYFGADSSGLFVCEVRNGTKDKVYQENWNRNIANGDEDAADNPTGFTFDPSKGNIFQIQFVYYGYGPVTMEVLSSSGKVTLHKFIHDGSTSVENTNLPLQAQIDNNSTNSDALDLYVGGRQFSIIGQETSTRRRVLHRLDSLAVDDTKWHAAISLKLKDGTDIGSIDFKHVLGRVLNFEADTDATLYRWQLRRGGTPNNPTWETPESHTDTPAETAMKVDTSSADIQDGSGNLTGVFIDGGTLSAGKKNDTNVVTNEPSAAIVNDQVVTLLVQAETGSSGTVSEITLKWTEQW